MSKKFIITIGILGVLAILVVLGYVSTFDYVNYVSASLVTDKSEYKSGDSLKIKIENSSEEQICFSSCFPYYFEKKGDGINAVRWQRYPYIECDKQNTADNCIAPKGVKAFEIEIPTLESIDKGLHRIRMPICTDCGNNSDFVESSEIYSNNFVVD